MAFFQQLLIEAGATYNGLQFQYLEDDEVTPVDLTGYTAKMHVRLNPSSALVVEVIPTIEVSTATISIEMTAAQTGLLTEPRYVYGVELTGPGGNPVIRFVEGEILAIPEVVY